ncbi:MAG: hypothetical protein HYT93_00215 [Parcubacteria group bacterium]|nr:hypothetical protein [Parcubacteria group bacterium]
MKFLIETFSIGILSSLIASIVFSLWLHFDRIPKLELDLNFIPGETITKGYKVPILDLSIFNSKSRLGFSSGDVAFGLLFPVDFIEKKELHLITLEGEKLWKVDTRAKPIYSIDGKDYYLYRGVASLPVHPDAKTLFLRIGGNFDRGILRIYYYFETPYGRIPKKLKFGERENWIRSGKLPHKEITII